jgi:hypothetical protein
MNPEFILVIAGLTAVLTTLSIFLGFSSESPIVMFAPQAILSVLGIFLILTSGIVGGSTGMGLAILAITAWMSSALSAVISLTAIAVMAAASR